MGIFCSKDDAITEKYVSESYDRHMIHQQTNRSYLATYQPTKLLMIKFPTKTSAMYYYSPNHE